MKMALFLVGLIGQVIFVNSDENYIMCGGDEDGCPPNGPCLCIPVKKEYLDDTYCMKLDPKIGCYRMDGKLDCSGVIVKGQARCLALVYQSEEDPACLVVGKNECIKHHSEFCKGNGECGLIMKNISTKNSDEQYIMCGEDEDGCPPDGPCLCVPVKMDQLNDTYCMKLDPKIGCYHMDGKSDCSGDGVVVKGKARCLALAYQSEEDLACQVVGKSECVVYHSEFCNDNGECELMKDLSPKKSDEQYIMCGEDEDACPPDGPCLCVPVKMDQLNDAYCMKLDPKIGCYRMDGKADCSGDGVIVEGKTHCLALAYQSEEDPACQVVRKSECVTYHSKFCNDNGEC